MCYTEDQKAAVLAALLAGQGVNEVAKKYDIPVGTVKSWKSRCKMQPVATLKAERIADLLDTYVEEMLLTGIEQQRHFRDKDWLNKQPASEIAVLHGVSFDKGIRLLEARYRGAETEEAESR